MSMNQQQFISALNDFSETQIEHWNNNTASDYLIAQTATLSDGTTQQKYDDCETYAGTADVDEVTDDINTNLNYAQLAGKNPCDQRPA